MIWWQWVLVVSVVAMLFGFFAEAGRKAEQKERWKKARIVDWPNIHGTRKIATESELKKAGLL